MKTSPGARMPRGRRGTVATVTALLGVLVFAAAATEAISMAAHGRTLLYHSGDLARYGRDTRLADTVVLVVAIAAFVVGVLLLLAALVPPRRRIVELTEPDRHVAAGLTRRSFRRTLAAAAVGVDGVGDARVRGRRRLKIRADTSFRDTAALPGRIEQRVTDRVNELNPARKTTVRVTVRTRGD